MPTQAHLTELSLIVSVARNSGTSRSSSAHAVPNEERSRPACFGAEEPGGGAGAAGLFWSRPGEGRMVAWSEGLGFQAACTAASMTRESSMVAA